MNLFRKKHKVLARDFSNNIIDAMLRGNTTSFWEFVKKEYNGDQEFNWAINENYIVFTEEKDYMMFLLKM